MKLKQRLYQALVVVLAGAILVGCAAQPQSTREEETPALPEVTMPATEPVTEEPSPEPTRPPAEGSPAVSHQARNLSPQVPPADQAEAVSGNTAFGLRLYQQLQEQPGNLIYSPYSISLALAMTYAGARTETETQMAETLNFTLPQDRLHPAFNSLDLHLNSLGEPGTARDDEGDAFTLRIANSLWGQAGYTFRSEFLDTLGVNYGTGLELVDFMTNPEGGRLAINEWVSDQTEERIQDLIPQGAINEFTRLVLANAIYFKASWSSQFEESATQDMPFYLLDGSSISVPMMGQTESFRYGQGAGYQAVELPYVGEQVAMTILVPDAGKFDDFEQTLDATRLEEILAALDRTEVALRLPRFSYESSFSLADTLSDLGMPLAFTDQADFSGMDGTDDLFIGAVIHKAFVAVDEVGTEAAAATAVVMQVESMPMEIIELTIDRPFMYIIRDLETGTILFIGRVVNPAGN